MRIKKIKRSVCSQLLKKSKIARDKTKQKSHSWQRAACSQEILTHDNSSVVLGLAVVWICIKLLPIRQPRNRQVLFHDTYTDAAMHMHMYTHPQTHTHYCWTSCLMRDQKMLWIRQEAQSGFWRMSLIPSHICKLFSVSHTVRKYEVCHVITCFHPFVENTSQKSTPLPHHPLAPPNDKKSVHLIIYKGDFLIPPFSTCTYFPWWTWYENCSSNLWTRRGATENCAVCLSFHVPFLLFKFAFISTIKNWTRR